MARPHALADPDFAKEVAEAFAAGCSRTEMCEMFGVKDKDTITRWRRDPRVKAIALKIIEDRVFMVSRKVDSVIAGRLANAEKMTITELLAIRKEFLGGALRAQTERADSDTVGEAQDWLEANPAAADQLEELLRTGTLPGVAPTGEE
jgi:hypothetical protein